MKTCIVCGSRDWTDGASIHTAMNQAIHDKRIPEWEMLVVGSDRGADWWAWQWALKREMPAMVFPARWSDEGRAAGPRRNQRMYNWAQPVVTLAFPGGRGTASMIGVARGGGTATFMFDVEKQQWEEVKG
jgi:hypothetical protein